MTSPAPTNQWHDVWTRKGRESTGLELTDLMRADGFDAGTGSLTVEDWLVEAALIAGKLALSRARNVLEVGCGAGAMLWPLRELGIALHGVDYSADLTQTAMRAIPGLEARTAEAAALPYPDGFFDAVFSHGVFFYFPDLAYGRRACQEILRVLNPATGRMFILDVPDADRREACERFRREEVYAGRDYPTSQDGPYRHLYYPRSFFADFAAEHGLEIELSDQDLASYPMSPYRFNALLRRPGAPAAFSAEEPAP